MKTHKTYFTQQDYERAFGRTFYDGDSIVDAVSEIFSERDFTPEYLPHTSSTRLDRLLKNLEKRKELLIIRSKIKESIGIGKKNMEEITQIILGQLEKLGLTDIKKDRVYDKRYQDVSFFCHSDGNLVARGLINPLLSLEEAAQRFTPENAYYSDLPSIFKNGRLICKHNGEDITLKNTGDLHVYRDKVSDEELEERVRKVIQGTGDSYYGKQIKSPNVRYDNAEPYLISKLHILFKTVKEGDNIVYKKVYAALERIIRENVDLRHLFKEDSNMQKSLRENIERFIPIPYAVIRSRIKEAGSTHEKIARALYNIRTKEEIDKKKDKRFEDLFGVRVILRDTDGVYALANSLAEIFGQDNVEVEDYITHTKKNQYRSYHVTISRGGMAYNLQIRTHQHDRDAEMDPRQSNRGYIADKSKRVQEIVPLQVRRVIESITGFESPLIVPYETRL